MQSVISDLTYGFRQIRRHMSTAAVCLLMLGVGIGSATAVFTVLYDAILKPLPYLSADQLVYVHNEFPQAQLARTGESGPDFADLTTHHEIFSNTAAYFFNDFTEAGSLKTCAPLATIRRITVDAPASRRSSPLLNAPFFWPQFMSASVDCWRPSRALCKSRFEGVVLKAVAKS